MKNKNSKSEKSVVKRNPWYQVWGFVTPEFFIIPFLILDVIILGACLIVAQRIGEMQYIKQIQNTESVTVPQLDGQNLNQVNARAFIVYNPQSRVVVDGKNEYLQFAPASTTKIMTALVALDYYRPQDVLIARNLSQVDGSKMNLIEGEAMTVQNLLYGLLLPSGNDAAFVLAQNYPGGQPAFVAAMNKKAHDFHLDNTVFVDPAGISDQNYTTAYDLARLANHALQNDLLAKIVKTRYATVYNTASTSAYPLTNLNELLFDPNVIGVKTGFTDEAGGVLVTAYKQQNQTYIVVVLKSLDRFFDTEQILYGIIPHITPVTYSSQHQ